MRFSIPIALAAFLGLYGCNMPANTPFAEASRHDRYVGIGTYPVGQMWSQVVVANPPKDTAASRASDDEQIIVVVDTATGEIRQCGNYSGYCVSMNPWARPLTPSQTAPVPLIKHAEPRPHEPGAAASSDATNTTDAALSH